MSKRKIFASLLVVVLSLVLASTSFATLARIQALGNSDLFFKDIYHIYVNPAYLGMYSNSVYAELGNYYYYDKVQQDGYNYGQFGGINLKIYKGLNLGLTLNRGITSPNWNFFSWMPVNSWYTNDFYDFPNYSSEYWGDWGIDQEDMIHRFDFMASYDWENMHLGLGFFHSGDKWTDTYWSPDTASIPDYDEEASASTMGITFGGLFNFGEDSKHSAEIFGTINFDKAKAEGTYPSDYFEKYETDGGTGMRVGGRAFLALFEKIDIVPVFGFASEKISMKYEDPDTEITSGDLKMSYFFGGLGANYKLDKGMVTGGLTVAQYVWDDQVYKGGDEYRAYYDKETEKIFPGFNIGVEYGLTKWLDGRMGIQEFFGKTKDEDGNHYYGYKETDEWLWNNYPEDFLSFGLGFKFSKFKVDATVYEYNFFHGTYLLSGQSAPIFGTLSATFEF
jgi:hypothetical protein